MEGVDIGFPGLAIEVGDEFAPDNEFGWSDLLADGVGAGIRQADTLDRAMVMRVYVYCRFNLGCEFG